MRVSARCDYTCRALLELSLNWEHRKPLHLREISKRQRIPVKYLVLILIQLKQLGIVESLRGKNGGYILAVPPSNIKLGWILKELFGPLLPLGESALKNKSIFLDIWKEAEDAMAGVLDSFTFEDIVNRIRGKKGVLFYQI